MAKRADIAKRVQRYDQGELAPPTVTPEGFLIAEGVIARAGVMHYVHADGTVTRELVPPEELAAPASLATLARKPTTIEHPPEHITADNVKTYEVGDVGESPRFVPDDAGGGALRALICVRAREGIEAIRNGGKSGLSPGYTCRIDETPGTHPIFGPYDAIQRDRVYNHVAHTDSPRGGPTVRLRVDSAYQIDPRGIPMLTRSYVLALLTAFGLANRADSILPEPEEGKTDEDTTIDVGALKGALEAMLGAYEALKAELAKGATGAPAAPEEEMNADEAAPEEEKENADEEGAEEEEMRGDSKRRRTPKRTVDPLAYANERIPLIELARELRIDSYHKLGNADLKRAIVRRLDDNAPPRMSEAYADAYIAAHRKLRLDARDQWRAGNGSGEGRQRDDSFEAPAAKLLNVYQTAHSQRFNR